MHLLELFSQSLLERSGAPALDCERADGSVATLTFGDLETRSNRLAHLLHRRGFRPGDRLAIHLPNRVEYIDCLLASIKCGAVLVPINILYRERELAHIVGDAEPRAIVTSGESGERFPAGSALWDIDGLMAEAAPEPGVRPDLHLDATAPAAIVYTSGTTGRSKGAVLSHANLAANAQNLVASWRITSDDRYLAVLPLFHVHGLAFGAMSWLASGCRMRLAERFDAARAAALFEEFQPTLFFGVPTIYVRLLEVDAAAAARIGARMRLFVSGSAPLSAAIHDAFKERFAHAILERYGMSETLVNISNPYDGERRAGSVGIPLPGVEVRIVDAELRGVAPGETGEVLVRGANVLRGYWRRPDADADAFTADGWFRTGDLASRSDDGYYTLCGRRSDLIISGGFNIYPREIEEVLLEIPGIRETAVVGVADDRRGELPIAYIVCDAPLDAEALDAHCRRLLASFKVPRAFIRVESLPRTPLGKVQKHRLPPWSPV